MATHSSILAWRILWTEEPGGLQSAHKESDTTERLSTYIAPAVLWADFSHMEEAGRKLPLSSRKERWELG